MTASLAAQVPWPPQVRLREQLTGPLLAEGLAEATTGKPLRLASATVADADAETVLREDPDATDEEEAVTSVGVGDIAADAEAEAAAIDELAADVAAGDKLTEAVAALELATGALMLGE
jgi:hypothetical protein